MSRIKFLSIILSLLIVTDAYSGAHNNKISFMTYYQVDSTHMKMEDYVDGKITIKEVKISEGQEDKERKYSSGSTVPVKDGEAIFRVGRHGTKDVAKWFNETITPSNTVYNHDPSELNFAFLVDLHLTFHDHSLTFKDIVLAQGHASAKNNWWFGGKHCGAILGEGLNGVVCKGSDQEGILYDIRFIRSADSVSTILVEDIFKSDEELNISPAC
ncbi:hypothetical protein [Fangia hongkongensis]|uniref:hypothetical protein n=1 Tax=Fangia hongkongensis TaxID=270495 RepID=UPI000364493B|nr:hypothetical protein [Fangia hongkongensis]